MDMPKPKMVPPYYINMNNGHPECPECGALYDHKPGNGVLENCLMCGANMVTREEPTEEAID
jgi:predicted  nucleic acid-binding Zn-ribbon protein